VFWEIGSIVAWGVQGRTCRPRVIPDKATPILRSEGCKYCCWQASGCVTFGIVNYNTIAAFEDLLDEPAQHDGFASTGGAEQPQMLGLMGTADGDARRNHETGAEITQYRAEFANI
jgi:hypothetical protein